MPRTVLPATPPPSRYSRQELFPAIGREGQRRLGGARVAVVGCGATGSAVAELRARAGVGYLRIVDRDVVEWTNLQRQVLFTEEDARESVPKAAAAEAQLRRVNSDIRVEGVVADLDARSADRLLDNLDLVCDGSDNFETRYLINDHCVRENRPWVYCGAVASYGMVMPVRPGVTACFRCIFSQPPPAGTAATCDTAGVLGPAVTAAASLAAVAALKLLLDALPEAEYGITHLDVWETGHEFVRARRRADCPCCAGREFPWLRAGTGSMATSLCVRNAVQVSPAEPAALSLPHLAVRLAPVAEVKLTPYLLKARVPEHELTLFPDGRALVHGTDDETAARSLYARYVGS